METKQEEKKTIPMPSKEIKVKIGVNDYVIKSPTNGQRIDIASLKQRLTQGKYQDMLYGDAESVQAYQLAGAIATFTVLIPEINKDTVGLSLDQLDIQQSITLLRAYEEYYEWQNKWREFINQDMK